jgi:hypothetical protein
MTKNKYKQQHRCKIQKITKDNKKKINSNLDSNPATTLEGILKTIRKDASKTGCSGPY